ncbi:MAG: DUF86 domain-containing protein [Turicibacter sp.]|nr:DUF86 domain-containing protein [Turicibacter sp.]
MSNSFGFLEHMIEDCEDILFIKKQFASYEEFEKNRPLHKSIVYSMLDLGELMKSFDKDERLKYPQIPWKHIIGFRDRAAHGYKLLNLKIVWDLVELYIEVLLQELRQLQQIKINKANVEEDNPSQDTQLTPSTSFTTKPEK